MINKMEEKEEKGEDPSNVAIGETYASELINQRTGFPQFKVLKDASKKKVEKDAAANNS